MALTTKHNDVVFGVGDTVRVSQKIVEAGKARTAVFEGMVIAIGGNEGQRMFTVRRIGAQKIGIEQIFPVDTPTIEKVEVTRKGTAGVRQAKLYYTRDKSRKEIESIYSRANRKNKPQETKKSNTAKGRKKVVKKAATKTKSKTVKKTVKK